MTLDHAKKLARQQKYRESHREELRLKSKDYYSTHQAEHNAVVQEYRESHREELKTSSRAYYETHREQIRAREREWTHKTGECRPMSENKECSSFLGVHVAERVLSALFEHVERMPYGNTGFDFYCGKGKKIDCKSSCLRSNNTWQFDIDLNPDADAFLCIAFNNREDLDPQHVWLVPASEVNHLQTFGIYNSPNGIAKWSQYEKPLDKVITCCTELHK